MGLRDVPTSRPTDSQDRARHRLVDLAVLGVLITLALQFSPVA